MGISRLSHQLLSKHSGPFTAWSPGFFLSVYGLLFSPSDLLFQEDSFFTFPIPLKPFLTTEAWPLPYVPWVPGASIALICTLGKWIIFSLSPPPHEHFKSRYTSHSSLNIQLQLLPGSVLLKAKYTPSLDASARPWLRHGFGTCHHRAVESRAFAIRQETIAWPSLTFIFLICKMVI